MRYQHAQTGCWLLGLVILSGCVTTIPPTDSLPPLPCPMTPTVSQDQATSTNKNRATLTQTLQKRLQEREQTIAAQTQQIEVLSSQLKALKQIDQETRSQPRKRLTYPIP